MSENINNNSNPIDSKSLIKEKYLVKGEEDKFTKTTEYQTSYISFKSDLVDDYLKSLIEKDIDTLVLGCTHYPLLTGVISYVMGNEVTLVSSAEETAKDLYRILVEKDMLNSSGKPSHKFVSTGESEMFSRLARRFLGPEVTRVESRI